MAKKLLLALAFMASAGSMFAAEYWVASNGADNNPGTQAKPFGSPEWALICCKAGETTTIHLEKDATFMVGALRIEDNCIVRLVGENSTLKAAEKSFLEGGEGLRILRIGANTDVEVSGINFVNGRQVGYFPGGGIFGMGKRLVVDNCSFIDNMGSSGGGGIHCRGEYLEVRNSYFSGNNVEGGGGTGAAIAMTGSATTGEGELVVENCAFFDNHIDNGGGHGTVISIFDAGIGYGITNKATVSNCTFLNNYNAQPYQADIDFSDNGECLTILVNNTFVNCEVAYNLDYQTEPVYMFNNFVFAKKNALSATLSIADDRGEITAANNILLGGEDALNANMDDAMLKSYDNVLGKTADHSLASYGMSSSLSREGNIGYLMTTPSSSLAEAGLLSSAEFSEGVNYIPARDCRGAIKEGVKCIGAYQAGGTGVNEIMVDNSNAPVEYFNLLGVRVNNPENGIYIVRQGTSVRKVLVK